MCIFFTVGEPDHNTPQKVYTKIVYYDNNSVPIRDDPVPKEALYQLLLIILEAVMDMPYLEVEKKERRNNFFKRRKGESLKQNF